MKRILVLFLCFIVCPVFAQKATGFCSNMAPRVYVRPRIGTPQYSSAYSKEEFLKKSGRPTDPNTLGLTVVEMSMNAKVSPSVQQRSGEICVGISKLEVELYFPTFKVYIDKKYPHSSCEYKIIKEHENYHVAVAQQALIFYKKDVEKAAYKALKGLSPRIVHSQSEIQAAVDSLSSPVFSAVNAVIQHINRKLIEKNAAIDTPEMYRATTAKCSHW